MTGYIDHLVAQALGTLPVLQPRPRSRFEPVTDDLASALPAPPGISPHARPDLASWHGADVAHDPMTGDDPEAGYRQDRPGRPATRPASLTGVPPAAAAAPPTAGPIAAAADAGQPWPAGQSAHDPGTASAAMAGTAFPAKPGLLEDAGEPGGRSTRALSAEAASPQPVPSFHPGNPLATAGALDQGRDAGRPVDAAVPAADSPAGTGSQAMVPKAVAPTASDRLPGRDRAGRAAMATSAAREVLAGPAAAAAASLYADSFTPYAPVSWDVDAPRAFSGVHAGPGSGMAVAPQQGPDAPAAMADGAVPAPLQHVVAEDAVPAPRQHVAAEDVIPVLRRPATGGSPFPASAEVELESSPEVPPLARLQPGTEEAVLGTPVVLGRPSAPSRPDRLMAPARHRITEGTAASSVTVHIGRVEVNPPATQPAPAQAPPPAGPQPLSLDAYLHRRGDGTP